MKQPYYLPPLLFFLLLNCDLSSANPPQFNQTYENLFDCCVVKKGHGYYHGDLDMPVSENLDDFESIQEALFAADIQHDLKEAEQKYNKIEETMNGKIIDTDQARNLYHEYVKASSPEKRLKYSMATSMPANVFVDYLYYKKLADLIKNHDQEDPNISLVILAGGYGSGKTTCIRKLKLPILKEASLIRDRSMDEEFITPKKMIEAALKLNIEVTIVYVFRPIERAFEGILKRARAVGRVQPIIETADAHWQAQENTLKLAEHFGDRINVIVIDNSGSLDAARVADNGIAFLQSPGVTYGTKEAALSRIKEEYHHLEKENFDPKVISILEKGLFVEAESTEGGTFWPRWLTEQIERMFATERLEKEEL